MKDDNYRTYVTLLQSNEAALRCFIRSLMPSWNDVDDVMQEVSLVLWEKFEEFDQSTNFLRWAYVIARFKVMNFCSKKGRERLHFDNDLLELMAAECEEEEDMRKSEEKAMWSCMEDIPESRKMLLLNSSRKGVTVKSIAEELGKTPKSLYRTLDRLKENLLKCIQGKLREEGIS
ncbi:MAG: sigma-70 family RNA polymerase sigma factor [Lentisphaeraceae bacterium]|nr:sigma-70 family RNA polymerase sigma factor [Lentisphaeraceae bacterium]